MSGYSEDGRLPGPDGPHQDPRHESRNYGFETQILTARLRHPLPVTEAALAGVDVSTLPPDVLEKLLTHPLTDLGLERFPKDWNAWKTKQDA